MELLWELPAEQISRASLAQRSPVPQEHPPSRLFRLLAFPHYHPFAAQKAEARKALPQPLLHTTYA